MQLKKYNIKQKFAIVITVLVVVFSLVFFFGYYVVYSQLMESLMINQYQNLQNVNQEISQYFVEIKEKIDNFIGTSTVRSYLYSNIDFEKEKEFLIHFKKDLHETTTTAFLNSVYVIKKDRYLGSNYNSKIEDERIDDLIQYIKNNYKNTFKAQLISVPKGEFSSEGLIFYCIPVPTKLISSMDKTFIALDIDPKLFDSVLSRHFSAMSQTFPFGYAFFDDDKNLIYTSEGYAQNENNLEEILVAQNCYERVKIDGKSTLVLNRNIYEAKVFVSLRMRLADVLKPTLKSTIIVLVMFLVTILFIALFAMQMTKGITKRLSKMLGVMDKVEKGNLDVHYDIEHNDEISIIGRKFNTMIDNLKNMKINMMALRLRQREAELSNLQSYIKPHFLINTIEAIRMTAILENDNVTAEQLMMLGQSFQYMNTFNKGMKYVTVWDEVENVKVYLSLIKLRFGDKYQITMGVDDEIHEFTSLQLILQPIVENVFIHGLRNKKSGSMKVIGYKDKNDIVFDVIDDGVGISEKKLSKIMESFAQTEKSSLEGSIGMQNVNARLKLAYGEQYGVLLFSELGKGTKVRILFPAQEKD